MKNAHKKNNFINISVRVICFCGVALFALVAIGNLDYTSSANPKVITKAQAKID